MQIQFGEVLAELRKDRNLKQTELAAHLFVTPGTISNYENGISMPNIEMAIKIADYFHVSLDYLFGRVSAPISPEYFERNYAGSISIGELISKLETLPESDRSTIMTVIDRFTFKVFVKNR